MNENELLRELDKLQIELNRSRNILAMQVQTLRNRIEADVEEKLDSESKRMEVK